MPAKPKIFSDLERIAPLIPAPLLWTDKNYVALGCNDLVLEAVGVTSAEELIGKDPREYLSSDILNMAIKNANQVLRKKKLLVFEEPVNDVITGEIRYFLMARAPLFADNGIDIVGTIVSGIDITDRKKLEQARAENEKQAAIIAEQKKFTALVDSFAHDIKNSVGILVNCMDLYREEIPEKARHALSTAKAQVENIAYALLANYNARNRAEYEAREAKRPVLVPLTVLELLAAKRYQYREQLVELNCVINGTSKFIFIEIGLTSFERMLGNLISNAVDALDGKEGEITVTITGDKEQVKIVVADNGKGMPPEVLAKLKNNDFITHGKADGHGLGMKQILTAVSAHNGEIAIESTLGQGTKIIITFPAVPLPEWAVDEILLQSGDLVVVVDDDPYIHECWDARLKEYNDIISIKHFTQGTEAVDFINNNGVLKQKMVLLSDYELLKQETNGLKVIAATEVPRSYLVTNHFTNHKILALVKKAHVRMLPKTLVFDVAIKFVK